MWYQFVYTKKKRGIFRQSERTHIEFIKADRIEQARDIYLKRNPTTPVQTITVWKPKYGEYAEEINNKILDYLSNE